MKYKADSELLWLVKPSSFPNSLVPDATGEKLPKALRAFCPSGEGGGIDNSCGGEGGGAASGTPSKKTAEAVSLYSKSFINSKKISSESKSIITKSESPTTGFEKEAQLVLDSIRSQPEKQVQLHRGISFQQPFAPLESASVGQSITLDRISSFSEDKETAKYYAGLAPEKAYRYELVLAGKAKTLKTDEHSGLKHREHITTGEFEVVEIKTENSGYRATIHIRQKSVF